MYDAIGDLMDPETMTIREMCDAFDVTPRTLRFYESKELLFPIRDGQKRLFTRRDRARLKLILRGKRFGFSLEEIRQLLELYHVGDQQETQLKRTLEVAQTRLEDLEQRRTELDAAISEMKSQMDLVRDMLGDVPEDDRDACPPLHFSARIRIIMPDYTAPTKDMAYVLHDVLKVQDRDIPGYADLEPDFTSAVLDEAAKIASDVLAPLNAVGDQEGCTLENGVVRTPKGFRDAFEQVKEGGWTGLDMPEE